VGSNEQTGSPRYSVEEKAQEVLDKLGEDFAITKHDGSLINGFEIVTAPAPLEEHYKRFEKFRSKTKGLTCESGRAGMHVHVSRAPLTQLQIGKLLVFINDPNNRPHIKKIASRDSNGFCKSSVKKIRDVRHDAGDRYQSINLQNRATIEYRIFKATTNVDSILKSSWLPPWSGQARPACDSLGGTTSLPTWARHRDTTRTLPSGCETTATSRNRRHPSRRHSNQNPRSSACV
jgi:hypothetical protein